MGSTADHVRKAEEMLAQLEDPNFALSDSESKWGVKMAELHLLTSIAKSLRILAIESNRKQP